MPDSQPKKSLGAGAVTALGIVFGDLGTSPLYTYQTVVQDAGNADRVTQLGSLSLLVWALFIVVTLKYAVLVMRADNHGEGGILALLSLVGARATGSWLSRAMLLVAAGLFGACLLYGDGVITPAISVLSAVEGLNTATSAFRPYVLPIALAILVGLFCAQPLGTARIGALFGPVMLLWFIAIGLIGLLNIVAHPAVLQGLDPRLGLIFLARHGVGSLVLLSGVFLALTGAEALYADMSHVGRTPVRVAWGVVVFPALILSYAGQTAVLSAAPNGGNGNPFFAAIPHMLLIPMVILATLATIIASQAIITGVFTLTRQAMQLGWFPSVAIRQTSDEEYGQIYVPVLNWVLMAGTLLIAAAFGSSDRLAAAYGTAVSTTMLMTTLLLFSVMRARWGWSLAQALPVALAFLLVDLVFFAANLLKIVSGGFVPLVIALVLFTIMVTWQRGMALMREGLQEFEAAGDKLLPRIFDGSLPRTPGSLVFLTRSEARLPPAIIRYAATFQSLPEHIVSVTVIFADVPRVAQAEKVRVEKIGQNLWHITARFGFVELPNLHAALGIAREQGCDIERDKAYFIVSRDDVYPAAQPRLAAWRRALFAFLYRNAALASDRFYLPRERVVEIGRQVEL